MNPGPNTAGKPLVQYQNLSNTVHITIPDPESEITTVIDTTQNNSI